MNPFQAVRTTIYEVLQADQALPHFFHGAVDFLSQAHIYYRAYTQVRIYENAAQHPNQGHPAIYGAALQLIGNFTTMGSYAVNVALVTKCTLDLLREYRQLGQNYQTLRQTIRGQYPLYQSVNWNQERENAQGLLTPSVDLSWRVQMTKFSQQMMQINRCAWDVFKQMFKLSMSLCDAYLLCNNDPQMRYEACTGLIAQWDNYQKELQENQERIVEEMEKGSDVADRILNRLGIDKNSALIISQLKKGLATGTTAVRENVQDSVEGTVDSVFVKGHITAIHIDFSESKTHNPALPQGRFAPWAGQEVFVPPSQLVKKSKDLSRTTFSNRLQGFMKIGKQVACQIYQGPAQTKDLSASPFD